MQFAVTADCHFPVQKMPCFTVRMNIQTKRLNPVKAGRVPAEPRYTVTTPALTGAIRASDPDRAAATPRFNRGQPVHPGDIKHFNTFPVEPRSSTVHPGGAPVHPGRAPAHPGRCLITHWGSAGIILRLGLNRIVTRGKFTGRHVRSKQ